MSDSFGRRWIVLLASTLLLAGEYAREALKRGLQLEKKHRTKPYRFGVVGGTDSHTSPIWYTS